MADILIRLRQRCAVYTRKSSEEGLEQEFNSLHAQREACEAFVASQKHEGWSVIPTAYDDGGFSGGTLERPALRQLLADVRDGKVDIVVVYKIDRLSRSLFDFAKIVEIFEAQKVSFVSVTQSFNTSTSMGRLTLNVLLSFAQFEREVTGERIRDKIAASKRKGMWMGGNVPLGYDVCDRKLVINAAEAETVRRIFRLYAELGYIQKLKQELDRVGIRTKARMPASGRASGGRVFWVGHLREMLRNPIYIGRIAHKGEVYEGEHAAILDQGEWDQVQAGLTNQAWERSAGTHADAPSLVPGKVFGPNGERMSPSQTRKKGKAFRYYISRTLIEGGKDGIRIPAGEIEGAVIAQLVRYLSDRPNLLDLICASGRSPPALELALARASELVERLAGDDTATKRLLLKDLIQRVDVRSSELKITMAASEIVQMLTGDNLPQREPVVVAVVAEFRRHAKKIKLVLQGETPKPEIDPALVKAVARANKWFGMLLSGEAKSVAELARLETLPRRYVSSLMPLAFLAPDLVKTILGGTQSTQVSLDKLLNPNSMALDWGEQCERLE
jgi:DNA invertase Pin-like site-specific DNA recombinase